MAASPIIGNTRQVSTQDEGSLLVFYGTTLVDPNPGAVDTLTITVEGNGTLQDSTLTQVGPGIYRLPTASAGSVASWLSDIVFQLGAAAPGSVNVTRFILDVTSSAGTSASDNSTTVTDTAAPPNDTISLDPTVTYDNGIWTITGHATSYRGATSVLAQVNNGVSITSVSVPINADGSFSAALQASNKGLSSINFNEILSSGRVTASVEAPYNLSGPIVGEKFVAQKFDYAADGSTETATEFLRADGSRRIAVHASGQTFQSDSFDTFNNNSVPDTTFVFNPGFGRDVINGFRVDGTDHDTLNLKGVDFNNDVATVLNNSRDTAAGLLITDPMASSPGGGPGNHDKILFKGVTKDQFAQYQNQDINFHG